MTRKLCRENEDDLSLKAFNLQSIHWFIGFLIRKGEKDVGKSGSGNRQRRLVYLMPTTAWAILKQ
ncbi:MAG: hypothetical protein JRE61_12125 [Deltaproteobacteria bacterium]|nr:hypothetical protein [Deltaproteobacteria bacterium]